MTLVIDASAVVELLLRTPRGVAVAERLERDMLAPELLDVEVVSACARLVRSGAVAPGHADAVVRQLVRFPADRIAHAPLITSVWALRDRVRVADAFYVACAAAFRAPLLTCDARLAAAPLARTAVLLVR